MTLTYGHEAPTRLQRSHATYLEISIEDNCLVIAVEHRLRRWELSAVNNRSAEHLED